MMYIVTRRDHSELARLEATSVSDALNRYARSVSYDGSPRATYVVDAATGEATIIPGTLRSYVAGLRYCDTQGRLRDYEPASRAVYDERTDPDARAHAVADARDMARHHKGSPFVDWTLLGMPSDQGREYVGTGEL